jgi:hypothetical protein
VPLFRRKASDPELARAREAFGPLAERLEETQRALLAAIPSSRDPGVPIADAIRGFLSGLDAVEAMMPSWQSPSVDEVWHRCVRSLEQARREAERLADNAPDLDFESLNARTADVLEPLEVFTDVEQELRRR